MARSKREICEALADEFERTAYGLERQADKPDMTPIERRMLRLQGNVYRACAKRAREEGRKIANG